MTNEQRDSDDDTTASSMDERQPSIDRITAFEPGVDPASAASSGLATEGAMPQDRADETEAHDSDIAPGRQRIVRARTWLLPAIGVAVVSIAVFALLVPIAPAVAWIGIASQIGILGATVACSFAIPPSRRYRSRIFAWLIGIAAASALALLLIIIAIAWSNR